MKHWDSIFFTSTEEMAPPPSTHPVQLWKGNHRIEAVAMQSPAEPTSPQTWYPGCLMEEAEPTLAQLWCWRCKWEQVQQRRFWEEQCYRVQSPPPTFTSPL